MTTLTSIIPEHPSVSDVSSTLASLKLWRTRLPDAFDEANVHDILSCLEGVVSIDKTLFKALAGDPASSISIALRLPVVGELTHTIDLSMTMLLRVAIAGDVSSVIVMHYMIRRLPLPAHDKHLLEAAWLSRSRLVAEKSVRSHARNARAAVAAGEVA